MSSYSRTGRAFLDREIAAAIRLKNVGRYGRILNSFSSKAPRQEGKETESCF